jgi:excisionase family DNA binding protein
MTELEIITTRTAFFTCASLASYLQVSERTVRGWVADGTIPSYLIGGSRRIDPADVDRFVAGCKAA